MRFRKYLVRIMGCHMCSQSSVFATGSTQEVVPITFMREEIYQVREAHMLVQESLVTDRSRGAEIAAHAVSR